MIFFVVCTSKCAQKILNHNDKTKITGGPKYLHGIIKIIIIEG